MENLNEVKRLQQLAGINEIKVNKPNYKILKRNNDSTYSFILGKNTLIGYRDEDDGNTDTVTFHNLSDSDINYFKKEFNPESIIFSMDDEYDYDGDGVNWVMINTEEFEIK